MTYDVLAFPMFSCTTLKYEAFMNVNVTKAMQPCNDEQFGCKLDMNQLQVSRILIVCMCVYIGTQGVKVLDGISLLRICLSFTQMQTEELIISRSRAFSAPKGGNPIVLVREIRSTFNSFQLHKQSQGVRVVRVSDSVSVSKVSTELHFSLSCKQQKAYYSKASHATGRHNCDCRSG